MEKELTEEDIIRIRQIMHDLGKMFQTGCLLGNIRGVFESAETWEKKIKDKKCPYLTLIGLPLEEKEMKKIIVEKNYEKRKTPITG